MRAERGASIACPRVLTLESSPIVQSSARNSSTRALLSDTRHSIHASFGGKPMSAVMNSTHKPQSESTIYNVPNALTTARFALAIAVMVLIPMGHHFAAMVTFLIAASTDWMDGYYARKYGQVTKLGRIFDPFVDKIIICGSFIALVEVSGSPVASWMATIVVGRELLVTSLRGMIESTGGDFSASWLGKWKMVLQCAAVVSALLVLDSTEPAGWLITTTNVLVWGAIALTVYSGFDYTLIAARSMRGDSNATNE